jgi:hypothetical protein
MARALVNRTSIPNSSLGLRTAAQAAAAESAAAESQTTQNNILDNSFLSTTGAVFKFFNMATDVILETKEAVAESVWDDPDGYLTQFFTSSTELATSASNYYWNIYQDATEAASGSDPHFAIAYGNVNGAGSVTGSAALYTGNLTGSRTPSKAIYSQYKNLLLLPTDDKFTFGGTSSDDIVVVNFNRARYKEKLDPGNWELRLSGSLGNRSFIDNSGAGTNPTIGQSGRIFSIVSGTITGGSASSTVYGLAYPDVGILVFNPTLISQSAGIAFSTASSVAPGLTSNNGRFYTAINLGASFQARSEENITSNYYFVRVGHSEFNYSNNPTFVTGSLGLIRYGVFHTDPKVYITSVGLYNDSNELLAIAKLSKPVLKSFTREALIRIKLDF